MKVYVRSQKMIDPTSLFSSVSSSYIFSSDDNEEDEYNSNEKQHSEFNVMNAVKVS